MRHCSGLLSGRLICNRKYLKDTGINYGNKIISNPYQGTISYQRRQDSTKEWEEIDYTSKVYKDCGTPEGNLQ